jgi:hypothetical protein
MPDEEMIERVAKVLSPTSWQALNTKCDTKAKKKRREASLDYAQRCIKAMREPTEKMKKALDDAAPMYDDPAVYGEEYWTVAIDSILND